MKQIAVSKTSIAVGALHATQRSMGIRTLLLKGEGRSCSTVKRDSTRRLKRRIGSQIADFVKRYMAAHQRPLRTFRCTIHGAAPINRSKRGFVNTFRLTPPPPVTFCDVVAPGDADGDSHNHLADLDGGDVLGLAEADLHAGEAVVEVHESWGVEKRREREPTTTREERKLKKKKTRATESHWAARRHDTLGMPARALLNAAKPSFRPPRVC